MDPTDPSAKHRDRSLQLHLSTIGRPWIESPNCTIVAPARGGRWVLCRYIGTIGSCPYAHYQNPLCIALPACSQSPVVAPTVLLRSQSLPVRSVLADAGRFRWGFFTGGGVGITVRGCGTVFGLCMYRPRDPERAGSVQRGGYFLVCGAAGHD